MGINMLQLYKVSVTNSVEGRNRVEFVKLLKREENKKEITSVIRFK